MKIVIISPVFPYPKAGILPGIERFAENLALNLKKVGHQIKIITTFWNGGNRYDLYKGISILRVLDSKALFGKFGSIFRLNHFTFGLNLIKKRIFKYYYDSDAIILPLAIGFTGFLKIKKIPVFSVFHHYEIPESLVRYLEIPFFHYLEKHQFKKHKNIIAVSDASKKEIINHYGIEKKYIEIIPNGVNIEKFLPNNIDPSIKKKYGKYLLLYAGPFLKRKRIPILLRAMSYVVKRLPDAHLVLIGDGPLLNYCKNLSKSLGIQQNVSFLGFIKNEELLKYFASSTIFIFPSEIEGFGQVLLESMASGTPVICANKLPMSKIIENGGITFKLNNPIDLSKKIIELIKNPNKLKELRKNCLNIAKKYDWSHIAEVYTAYIKKNLNL